VSNLIAKLGFPVYPKFDVAPVFNKVEDVPRINVNPSPPVGCILNPKDALNVGGLVSWNDVL